MRIEESISPEKARRFYDRLGARYDWAAFYEGRAKSLGLEWLDLQPGQRLLNAGCGTGKEHLQLQEALVPGVAIGLDLSAVMAGLTRQRTGSPVCQATIWHLPLAGDSFDRLFSSYVLDLIPHNYLPRVLTEFGRVLAPGGRLVIITLTEGVTPASRALVTAWKALYAVAPIACGGCRPLQLADMVEAAGFNELSCRTVVQFGLPSEIITAVH